MSGVFILGLYKNNLLVLIMNRTRALYAKYEGLFNEILMKAVEMISVSTTAEKLTPIKFKRPTDK